MGIRVQISGNGRVYNEMIYLGADHRGFELKEKLKSYLGELGYVCDDLGAYTYNIEDDYPDFARKLVNKGDWGDKGDKGILICGSGVGMAVAANRFKGVRAGGPEGKDVDLNVLTLAADFLTEEQAKEAVKTFLEAKFSGEERHRRRIAKIDL
jgi:ribose 5-phosphate isomerase B